MNFGESITQIRKSKGITRKELAEQLDIPYTTLRNYETGQREPGHKLLIKMASLLSVSVDTLIGNQVKKEKAPPYSSEACKLAEDYDKRLDEHGKRMIRIVADEEITRCVAEAAAKAAPPPEESKVVRFRVPGYALPMSAGPGEEAGQEYPEDYTLVKAPPRGTSYIARVKGYSMEPTYYNGDLVFVNAYKEVPVGKVGVFLMNEKQYIKERGEGVLISHNPDQVKYHPIPFTEGIRCQGLVLGICDESYLLE